MKRGWLKRKTPLRAKVSLRDSWYRKKIFAEADKPKEKVNRLRMNRTALKKISRSQRRRLTKYYPTQKEFLRKPENEFCHICIAIGVSPPNRSTENHHIRGRNGRLLCDTRYFCPCCRTHRTWPHDNPREARALGLLAEAKDWGVYPATDAGIIQE